MTTLEEISEITATLFDPTACYFRKGDRVTLQRTHIDLYWAVILPDDVFEIACVTAELIYLKWANSDNDYGSSITWERARRLRLQHL